MQTDADYEQIFIVDDIGRGLLWANQSLNAYRNRVSGEYVYILDDDNHLIDRDFVLKVKSVARRETPDVIMLKILCRGLEFPFPEDWKHAPKFRGIDTLNFVVRTELYKKFIWNFGREQAEGDYHFITSLFEGNWSIYWLEGPPMALNPGRGRDKFEVGPKEK